MAQLHEIATEGAIWTHPARNRGTDQLLQHLARLEWRRQAATSAVLPSLDEVQFRAFSQNGEDGIIWFLLSLMGDGKKRAAEICAGNGIECCTANLVVNHGWEALMVDGDEGNISVGKNFYRHCRDAWYFPPNFVCAWVNAENVNALLKENGFDFDLDLLAIDIDGNDFWVWEGLRVRPRIVVVEFNPALGPDPAVAIRYDPDFKMVEGSEYHSASLRAFFHLAKSRDYSLVGIERYNFNAFFVRNDCLPAKLPVVSIESCFTHPWVQNAIEGYGQALLERFEWVSIPDPDAAIT